MFPFFKVIYQKVEGKKCMSNSSTLMAIQSSPRVSQLKPQQYEDARTWSCSQAAVLLSVLPWHTSHPHLIRVLAGAVACDVIWSYYREARGNFVPNSNVLALAVVCNCPGVLLPANPLAEIHYGQAATSTRTAMLKAQGLGLRKWLLFSD